MFRYVLAALSVVVLVLVAGCSSSGQSGGTASSGVPSAVCSSLTALKSSMAQLKQLDISTNSIDQLKSKLTAVGNDLRKLVDSAKGQYSKSADAIQHDYASLKSAIQIAVNNPTYPTIASVKTEFTTLANSVTHFARTVAAGC